MGLKDQGAIDGAPKAMEEDLKEKQRLAEEEAARKKAAAEGPALDAIPPEELLEHIEAIREIMAFQRSGKSDPDDVRAERPAQEYRGRRRCRSCQAR
ncbi:MAG: hypothetical protein QNJ04_12275 [Desulfobacterales bacterium]|nr:hypothetical protein [Desulfobacterales bacterium]